MQIVNHYTTITVSLVLASLLTLTMVKASASSSAGANLTAILAQNGITSQSETRAFYDTLFNSQSGKHFEVKYYSNGTRYFCVPPGSEMGAMMTHSIQVEQSVEQLMNQSQLDQLNHAIPKIQKFFCPG